MKKQLFLNALLHGRRGWTAEYRHAHADVANIGVPRFQVAQGPLNPHGTLQSVRDGCGRCLPITGDLQASRSDKALIIHGGCPLSKMLHIMFGASPCRVELNIINLFGGGCGVISSSAGYSIDSTCSTTFVRCVARASSSPMSPLASLTSMTLSRIRRVPNLRERSPTWSADRYQLF